MAGRKRTGAKLHGGAPGASLSENDAEQPEIVIEFANERSRIVYETVQAVDRIAASIEPEGRDLHTSPIKFAKKDAVRGLTAVMNAGTVIYTSRPSVILVPERSLRILRELRIPYELAPAGSGPR